MTINVCIPFKYKTIVHKLDGLLLLPRMASLTYGGLNTISEFSCKM